MYSQELFPHPIRYSGPDDALNRTSFHPKLLSGQRPSFTQIRVSGNLRWTRNSPYAAVAISRSPNTSSASTAATTFSRTGGEPHRPVRRSIHHSNSPRPQQALYPRTLIFPDPSRKASCRHFRWPLSWNPPATPRTRRRGKSF